MSGDILPSQPMPDDEAALILSGLNDAGIEVGIDGLPADLEWRNLVRADSGSDGWTEILQLGIQYRRDMREQNRIV